MSAVVTAENPLTRKLWHIAGTGDLDQLKQLLNQGAEVNAGDRTGVTALMRAAYHGQLTMVRALIERGADPNAKDQSGLSALTMAKHAGHQEIVETLISHGAESKTNAARPRRVVSVAAENISPAPVKHEPILEPARAETRDAVHDANHEATREAAYDATREMKHEEIHETTISQTPAVRTLQEPPDIWDLVHTTQPEAPSPPISPRRFSPAKFAGGKLFGRFVPGRIALRRIVSMRTLVLASGAVIVSAGITFGLLALRSTGNTLEETEQRAEAAELESTSSDEPPSNVKATRDRAGKITRRAVDLTRIKSVGRLGEPSRPSAPPVLAATTMSTKKPTANPRTAPSAHLSRHNRNVRNTTRGESEPGANTKSARKEQPPPPADPVKPTVTQKPKVIQWP